MLVRQLEESGSDRVVQSAHPTSGVRGTASTVRVHSPGKFALIDLACVMLSVRPRSLCYVVGPERKSPPAANCSLEWRCGTLGSANRDAAEAYTLGILLGVTFIWVLLCMHSHSTPLHFPIALALSLPATPFKLYYIQSRDVRDLSLSVTATLKAEDWTTFVS